MKKISPKQILESEEKRFFTAADANTLRNKADKLTTYTKKEVDGKLALAAAGSTPTFTHSFDSGNRLHKLTKPEQLVMPTSGIFTVRFIATAPYTAGDGFYIDRTYAGQDISMNSLPSDVFVEGSIILAEIDVDHAVISFNLAKRTEGAVSPTPADIQYNVFCQEAEPPGKEGIWLQTSRTYDNILMKDHFAIGGQWDAKAEMRPIPTKREAFRVVSDGERIYCIGGIETGTRQYSASIEIYDIRTNLWTLGAVADIPRASFGCVLHDGLIYCIGGENSEGLLDSVSIYNTRRDVWSTGRPLPKPNRDMGCGVYGARIFTVGGLGECERSVLAYSVVSGAWEEISQSPTPRLSAGVALYGSRLYCIGGYRSNNTADYYDIAENTWTSCANMPLIGSGTGDFDFGCEISEEKIYCIGGRDKNYVKVYDVYHNTWSVGEHAPVPLSRFSCFGTALVDRDIYVMTNDAMPVYHISTEQMADNTLAILDYPNRYSTKIITNSPADYIRLYFGDVWIYRNGKMQRYPTFVGDGTRWSKIKN